jgi:hypothetical protein
MSPAPRSPVAPQEALYAHVADLMPPRPDLGCDGPQGQSPDLHGDQLADRPFEAAHEQRVAQIADIVRRIPGAEGPANAARALRKLQSDPDAVRALIDLLAVASSPPLRRPTGRHKVGLLPGEALQRLKDDLANAANLEPVVVYAADLRALIELAERGC